MSYGQTSLPPTVTVRRATRWARFLLLLPFLAVFWVPGREAIDPVVLGVSFVYWYQAVWIMISAALVFIVYRLEN